MKAKLKDVLYGESKRESLSSSYQDISIFDKVEGCCITTTRGCLKAMSERFQRCVEDTKENRDLGDSWMESEDEGHIFVIFYTIESFLNYYNLSTECVGA